MKEGLLTPRGWVVVREKEQRIGGCVTLFERNVLVLYTALFVVVIELHIPLLSPGRFC